MKTGTHGPSGGLLESEEALLGEVRQGRDQVTARRMCLNRAEPEERPGVLELAWNPGFMAEVN